MSTLDNRLELVYDAVRGGCLVVFRSPSTNSGFSSESPVCDRCVTVTRNPDNRISMIYVHGTWDCVPVIVGLHGQLMREPMVAILAMDHAEGRDTSQSVYRDSVTVPLEGTRFEDTLFSHYGMRIPDQAQSQILIDQSAHSLALWFGPGPQTKPPTLVDPEFELEIWMSSTSLSNRSRLTDGFPRRPFHELHGLRLPFRSMDSHFPIDWLEIEYADLK